MSSRQANLIKEILFHYKTLNEDSFIKYLTNRGFKRIGSGITRTVYGNGKIVVKIDESCYANADEYATWEKLKNTPFKYLVAPIIGYATKDGGLPIIIMPQCKKVTLKVAPLSSDLDEEPTSKKYKRQANAICDIFYDVFSGNFLMFKNNIVSIDYANGIKEKNKRLFNRWVRGANIKEYKTKYNKELAR